MTATGGKTKPKATVAFDLDAARAARREVAGEKFTFRFGGEIYSALPAKEWPIATIGLLSDGNITGAVEAILGGKQFESFMKHSPTSGDVEDLMNSLSAYSGVGDLEDLEQPV